MQDRELKRKEDLVMKQLLNALSRILDFDWDGDVDGDDFFLVWQTQ